MRTTGILCPDTSSFCHLEWSRDICLLFVFVSVIAGDSSTLLLLRQLADPVGMTYGAILLFFPIAPSVFVWYFGRLWRVFLLLLLWRVCGVDPYFLFQASVRVREVHS